MKKICLLSVLTAIAFSLCACETVEGFGRDLEKVGGKIEKAATKEQKAEVEDAQPN